MEVCEIWRETTFFIKQNIENEHGLIYTCKYKFITLTICSAEGQAFAWFDVGLATLQKIILWTVST